jgi:hypothetical protein
VLVGLGDVRAESSRDRRPNPGFGKDAEAQLCRKRGFGLERFYGSERRIQAFAADRQPINASTEQIPPRVATDGGIGRLVI